MKKMTILEMKKMSARFICCVHRTAFFDRTCIRVTIIDAVSCNQTD